MVRRCSFQGGVIIRVDANELQADQLIGPIDDPQVDGLNAAPGERDAEQASRFDSVENSDRNLCFCVLLRLGARRERAERWIRRVWSRQESPQIGSQCTYHDEILATRRRAVQGGNCDRVRNLLRIDSVAAEVSWLVWTRGPC